MLQSGNENKIEHRQAQSPEDEVLYLEFRQAIEKHEENLGIENVHQELCPNGPSGLIDTPQDVCAKYSR